MLFDGAALALSFGCFGGAGRRELAGLHELADVAAKKESEHWRGFAIRGLGGRLCGGLRLEELVAALEFLVLRLYDFHAVDDFEEAGLQGFCLPGEGCQSGIPRS